MRRFSPTQRGKTLPLAVSLVAGTGCGKDRVGKPIDFMLHGHPNCKVRHSKAHVPSESQNTINLRRTVFAKRLSMGFVTFNEKV